MMYLKQLLQYSGTREDSELVLEGSFPLDVILNSLS